MQSRSGDSKQLRRRAPAWWKSNLRRRTEEPAIVHRGPAKKRGVAMTIGKKLYLNFGLVLLMVLVLFLVNITAVYREHSAKAAASHALQVAEATDKVRFQMMQNRLYLSNYLLSGDSREVDRMTEGMRQLNEYLQDSQKLASSDQQHSALDGVGKNETAWVAEFAQPMLQKRREV